MKKRDIIIVTVCTATALICISLTFWGNYKNNGVLSPDAFYGVLATFIGICATIIVGFQIASFVKIHETERQFKEIRDERDKMEEEKKDLQDKLDFIENELSNSFIIIAKASNNNSLKICARLLSISCTNFNKDIESILNRYKNLQRDLKKSTSDEIVDAAQLVYKIKKLHIPNDIKHYTEIMKIHIEIIEKLEKVAKEQKANQTKQYEQDENENDQ